MSQDKSETTDLGHVTPWPEPTTRAEDCLRQAYGYLSILEDYAKHGQTSSPAPVLRWLCEAVNELIQTEKRRAR